MRASRAGPLAAQALASDRRGRVVSVHARAVNLLFDGGPLVALLPKDAPLHPWALSVALDPAAFAWLAEGDTATVSADVLEVGPLKIELENVPVAELRLTRRPRILRRAQVRALARLVRPAAAEDPFQEVLDTALEQFRAGSEAGDLTAIVGVGEGLTPSGDDILVGVLAGLDSAHWLSREVPTLRQDLVVALGGCAARTTRLSAQMLAAAAARLYAEPVLGVLDALCDGGAAPAVLEQAVDSLLAVGHRSGTDTLRGTVAALERVGVSQRG
jgi:hypothetical protein